MPLNALNKKSCADVATLPIPIGRDNLVRCELFGFFWLAIFLLMKIAEVQMHVGLGPEFAR